MDKLDLNMDSLELPELDGKDYENLADASEAFAEDLPEIKKPEPIFTEDYDDEEIAAPVLSEMDGSEFASKPKAEPEKPKSAPALGEMYGTSPSPEKSEAPKKSSMQQRMEQPFDMPGAYTPVSSSATAPKPAQSTYQSTSQPYSASSYSAQPQNKTTMDDFYAMTGNEDAIKGEKLAKRLSTAVIIASVLYALLGFSLLSLLNAVYDIYFAIRFRNGSDRARFYLGAGCTFSAINAIRMIVAVNKLTALAAQYDVTFIISVTQFILILITAGMGVLAYFFLLNKSVAEYCGKRGNW